MGFNKGEWSELYTFLYLLENPDLKIVDENLKVIQSNLFTILEILLNDCKYKIDDKGIKKIENSGETTDYKISYISDYNKVLLEKILKHKSAKGSFEIKEIEPLITELLDGKKPKGSSNVKGDINTNVLDNKTNNTVNLQYNIKSSLGSPATLLNASNNTNFIYELSNIDDDIMDKCNSINTKTKLIDRCSFLEKNNVIVNFKSVQSDIFDFNLKLIDSNLNTLLGNILYLSYKLNEKDIKTLISKIVKNNDDLTFYNKKIGDFTNAATFGMRAGEKWNGINEVKGGIIIVSKKGEIFLLDLVYFQDIVNKYLIDNIKLDSPSSSRYKMFEIYKDNGKYFFSLNLQIRFK